MGRDFLFIIQLTLLILCSCALSEEMIGGKVKQDPSDPIYLTLAKESLDKYKGTTNANVGTKIKVLSASTQLVSGVITRIVFRVSPKKGQGDTYLCKSSILEQSWTKIKNIDVNCVIQANKSKKNRGAPGDIEEVDPSSPEIMALAKETLEDYKIETATKDPLRVVRIDKASKQLVSGIITRIDYVAIGDEYNVLLKCHARVWDRDWLNKKHIQVNCENY